MTHRDLDSVEVTADELKAAYEEALTSRSAHDCVLLKKRLEDALSECGDWEAMAKAWRIKNLRTALRAQLQRDCIRPPTEKEQHRELRKLIRQYPILAREILGEIGL
ncbi:hypothetical protein [Nonomuraea typhae]|uniref:Uncharacterized protein n=1 Tax=Nonomuraea typhae TaxID=2603600 RepID=A0ABW7YTF0_9ACTN